MDRTLLTLPAWLLLVGCFDNGEHTLEDGPYCENTPTAISLGDAAAMGFSGADMLALTQGGFDETLTWAASATTTPIHISVGYAEGEVRFVDSIAVYPEGDGDTPAIGVECEDFMEVDVSIIITTEDGALDETYELALASADGVHVVANTSFDHTQMGGSYEYTLLDPSEYDDVSHGLALTFDEDGSRGELTAMAEGCDADCTGDECTCWASIDTVAYWPLDDSE